MKYEKAEMEVVLFEAEDIVTISGGGSGSVTECAGCDDD